MADSMAYSLNAVYRGTALADMSATCSCQSFVPAPETLERLLCVPRPLLPIPGEQNPVVPPAHSGHLYEAASNPERFELIPGSDHTDLDLLTHSRLIDCVVHPGRTLGRDHS